MVIGKKGWWSKWREWRECSRWSAEEEEEKRNRMVAKRRTKGILDISSSSGFFGCPLLIERYLPTIRNLRKRHKT